MYNLWLLKANLYFFFYFPKYLCRIRKILCAQCLHFDSSPDVFHLKASTHRSCNNTGWELHSASLCTNKSINVTEDQTPPYYIEYQLTHRNHPFSRTRPTASHSLPCSNPSSLIPKTVKGLIKTRAGESRDKVALKAS